MSIFEYDQEKHMRMEREEAWEEGHAEGHAQGHAEGFAEGRAQLFGLIEKKRKKGETAEQIAADLDEEVSVIEELLKEQGLHK